MHAELEGTQFLGDSMRPLPCTDANDMLRCSTAARNFGESGKPERYWDILRALKTGQSTQGLHLKHESELVYTCSLLIFACTHT